MPLWKCTLHLVQKPYGWSETFYRRSETGAEALKKTVALAVGRAQLLAQGVNIVRVEVHPLGTWRTNLVAGIKPTPLPGPASPATSGLIIRFAGRLPGLDVFYRRTWLLRGLPERFFRGPGRAGSQYDPALVAKAIGWLDSLNRDGWLLQVAAKDNPWHPVGDILLSALGDVDIVGNPLGQLAPAPVDTVLNVLLPAGIRIPEHDPETGKRATVFIRNVQWSDPRAARRAKVNGLHTVLGSAPGLVQLGGKWPGRGEYGASGWLQLRQTGWAEIVSSSIGGTGGRKTGKPRYPNALPVGADNPGPDEQAPSGPGEAPEPGDWNPGPVADTLSDLSDTQAYVWDNYQTDGAGNYLAISIAPIVNKPHTWIVALSGTWLTTFPATQILADITAALGQSSGYLFNVVAAVSATVPAGDKLIFAGHSLGGMIAQQAALACGALGRPAERLITFGSPLVAYPPGGAVIHRFAFPGDCVVCLSPAGGLLCLAGSPEQTFLDPGDISLNCADRHTQYPGAPALHQYDHEGTFIQGQGAEPYAMGAKLRFPVPPI